MLLRRLLLLLRLMGQAVSDPRPRRTFVPLAIGLLAGEKPKTITSALDFLGKNHQDWSNEYRLLSQARWDTQALFRPILQAAVQFHGDPDAPLFFAQDDTLLRKTGKSIPGSAYAPDPLGPRFQTNLVWGQRFLQSSFLLRSPGADGPSRSIPVSFLHAPPLKAPRGASPETENQVREQRKKYNLSVAAVAELSRLRSALDQMGLARRRMLVAVDGSFANRTYLRQLPHHCTAVARIRKNACLRTPLAAGERSGNRKYGRHLPTPEDILKDKSVPFRTFRVFVAGETRDLHYKCLDNVCWPKTTLDKPLSLVVIKAPGYRLRKNSKLLYRQPAYLVVSSSECSIEHAIEAYIARWEIEVNFREEKSTLGVGQAQVWNETSVRRAPAFLVAAYAALLLVSVQTFGNLRSEAFLPLPKWRNVPPKRPSLRDLIRLLRLEWKEQGPLVGLLADLSA